MLKRPHYIALAAVFLLVVILFKLPTETVAKVKLAIGGFFLPLFGLAGSTQQVLEKTGNSLVTRKELLQQNEQFRRQNQQLQIQLKQNEEIARENVQLRQLLGWQRPASWKLKLARVIGRDPANWWRTIQIDLGSRDEIQAGFPVLTAEGLVGRVAAEGQTRSQVVLLGDPNLRVAAVIEETRETGVMISSASKPLENNMLELAYLSRNSNLKSGQAVVTSGEGSIFPKGIPIGYIVDARSDDYGLSTEARVKLWAKINTLEEVWVMLNGNSEPAIQKPSAKKK